MNSISQLNHYMWLKVYDQLKYSSLIDNYKIASTNQVLKNCFKIVEINGLNYEQFTDDHNFFKPNDKRAFDLINHCAEITIKELKLHIRLAYGFSDKYSFVIDKKSEIYENISKTVSVIVSVFSSNFIYNWNKFFDIKLKYLPLFNGDLIFIPSYEKLSFYFQIKQNECNVKNLINTVYSALTGKYSNLNSFKSNIILTPVNALKKIKEEYYTKSKQNELLFKVYNINYNNEPEIFKKGNFFVKIDSDKLESYNVRLTEDFLFSLNKLHNFEH